MFKFISITASILSASSLAMAGTFSCLDTDGLKYSANIDSELNVSNLSIFDETDFNITDLSITKNHLNFTVMRDGITLEFKTTAKRPGVYEGTSELFWMGAGEKKESVHGGPRAGTKCILQLD